MKGNALFDTTILIDNLNGHAQALATRDRYTDHFISIVTWMEVLVGATAATEGFVRTFLKSFVLLDLTPAIAERAILIRRQKRLKLPDAIILASAEINGLTLVTRNTRDFVADAGIDIPYVL